MGFMWMLMVTMLFVFSHRLFSNYFYFWNYAGLSSWNTCVAATWAYKLLLTQVAAMRLVYSSGRKEVMFDKLLARLKADNVANEHFLRTNTDQRAHYYIFRNKGLGLCDLGVLALDAFFLVYSFFHYWLDAPTRLAIAITLTFTVINFVVALRHQQRVTLFKQRYHYRTLYAYLAFLQALIATDKLFDTEHHKAVRQLAYLIGYLSLLNDTELRVFLDALHLKDSKLINQQAVVLDLLHDKEAADILMGSDVLRQKVTNLVNDWFNLMLKTLLTNVKLEDQLTTTISRAKHYLDTLNVVSELRKD